jgi:hypothetical protein
MKKYLRLVAGTVVFALGLSAVPMLDRSSAQSTDTDTAAKSAKKRKKKTSTDTAAPAPVASTPVASATPAAPAAKATPAPANNASASEIASAQSSGKVWVNTETKVYHKSGRWYGKTKQGKFMTEDDAKKAGFHAAKSEIGAKKS